MTGNRWTDEELALLRLNANQPMEVLRQLFPRRDARSIRKRRVRDGLSNRPVLKYTQPKPCYFDGGCPYKRVKTMTSLCYLNGSLLCRFMNDEKTVECVTVP